MNIKSCSLLRHLTPNTARNLTRVCLTPTNLTLISQRRSESSRSSKRWSIYLLIKVNYPQNTKPRFSWIS